MADETQTETSKAEAGAPGFFAYWGPPVAIGLLVGLAIVGVVRYSGIGQTEVDGIVKRYEWGVHEMNQELAGEVAALGASARRDVLDAFEECPGGDWSEHEAYLGREMSDESTRISDELDDWADEEPEPRGGVPGWAKFCGLQRS